MPEPRRDSITRRTLLRAGGVMSLAAAVSGAFSGLSVAHATPADLDRLRSRWVDQLTGRATLDPTDADVRAALGRLDTAVATSVALLDPAPDRGTVFTDLTFTNDAHVVTTYTRLSQLAVAWATPGSAHHDDPTRLAQVLAGLADTHRLVYHAGRAEFGNWWSWEIGAPKALADILAVVADHLDADQVRDHTAAIDHFVPDPWQQFPPGRTTVSEGANRVDLCQAVIIRAIVGGDTARLQHAVDGLTITWQPVTSGTGFFHDGSFIQHSTMAYTGTYGVVLLGGLAKLFALLAGSTSAIDDDSRQLLFDTVEQSYAPFVHDGAMSESVRGRAISRTAERGFDDGNGCLEAILRLAGAVDADTRRRWQGICRGWLERNHTTPPVQTASVPRLALIKQVLASDVPASPEPTGPKIFNAMARAVHRGPGWMISLGMSSRTIGWYECGNGENDLGYHTGDGVTYLAVSDDQDHFDHGFWPTVDLDRLPGTTVDTTPLAPKVEGEWAARCPVNDWTGGVALDGVAVVGQHVVGPGGTGLTARKLWFLGPDRVVALGAGIGTGTDQPVETIIENRNLGDRTRTLLLDGRRVGGSVTRHRGPHRPRWAHLDGVAGYLLLDVDDLEVATERRTGSWRRINTGGPADPVSATWTRLVARHGSRPDGATYGYVVLPTATARRTRAEADRRRTTVLANTATVQVVRTDDVVALCSWAPARAAGYAVDGPAAVLLRPRGRDLRLAVLEPTGSRDQVVLTLPGRFRSVTGSATLTATHGSTAVTVDTSARDRAGVTLTLRR